MFVCFAICEQICKKVGNTYLTAEPEYAHYENTIFFPFFAIDVFGIDRNFFQKNVIKVGVLNRICRRGSARKEVN